MKDYFSITKNRERAKGGVATVVANHLRPFIFKVGEGRGEDEYIITRFEHVVPAVNIVNIYGQQECRTAKEEILESFMRLKEDLDGIIERGEAVLILGDMNRAIGCDELGVKGNHS
jgi:exonuclease III